MQETILILITALTGYLLGAISFAVLIAKANGIDIFTFGSGNPGATNVRRAVGRKASFVCFFLDALKGFVAAGWPLLFLRGYSTSPTLLGVIGLIAAILGHSFSIFIKFRGGKGVATTVGGLLAMMPLVVVIGAIVWLISFYTTRYVSLASILLGISLPISSLLLNAEPMKSGLCLFIAILVLIRHRSNVKRLMNGTENRFGRKWN